MDPVKDAAPCYDQMAIVEKYEKVIAYLYPIAQSIPRKHGVARDMFLQRRQVSGAGQDEEVGMTPQTNIIPQVRRILQALEMRKA